MTEFFWDHRYIAPPFLPQRLCPIEDILGIQEGGEHIDGLQDELFNEFLREKEIWEKECNFLIFAEHEPVYTLKLAERERIESGDRKGLIKKNVEELPAPLFTPNETRGGSITFHGPGQLVCYMIMCLDDLGIENPIAINGIIESSIRELLAGFGIRAYTLLELVETAETTICDSLLAQGAIDEKRVVNDSASGVGVWVLTQEGLPKKIASRGIKCRSVKSKNPDTPPKHITKYGFALNISTDLSYFDHIHPCGLNLSMTSVKDLKGRVLHKTLGENPPMHRISELLASILIKNFELVSSVKSEET